ncbi:MAG: hypothetical protein AAGJ55_00165, partial [Cyanobacteria bacterium J06555_12]
LDFAEDYLAKGKKWRDLAVDRRSQFQDSRPLLLLYPIESQSRPRPVGKDKKSDRKPLDAVSDVLGIAIFFPRLDGDEPIGYVSANIDTTGFEEAEYEEEVIDA